MINIKNITQAIETLLKENTTGFTIGRNVIKNIDPNKGARGNGWLAIYRGDQTIEHLTVGGNNPWLAEVVVMVTIQRASLKNAADVEDKLQDSEKLVMDILAARNNLTLNGAVDFIKGFSITYDAEYNEDKQAYFHSSNIAIICEVRTG